MNEADMLGGYILLFHLLVLSSLSLQYEFLCPGIIELDQVKHALVDKFAAVGHASTHFHILLHEFTEE